MGKETKFDLFKELPLLAAENNIDVDSLIENLRQGILKAAKKDFPDCENIVVNIDIEAKKFEVKIIKTVVEGEPENPGTEIHIDEAKTISKRAKIGGIVEIKIDPKRFGRVAASSAKQSIRQDLKGYERDRLMKQFDSKREECVAAVVAKVEPATLNAVVTIDGNEAYLRRSEQIPGETLKAGDNIQVYVEAIIDTEKRPALKITRTKREMVKKLFEREVPEIYDGIVEIKAISREAGARTKIAVSSRDKNVDPVGACIGPKHTRISAIVKELKGEKIDIIPYSDDDREFIASALSPAQVLDVEILDEEIRSCRVTVPNNQLSLAIGNRGQNAKLAHHLTSYKIDIVPEHPVGEWD